MPGTRFDVAGLLLGQAGQQSQRGAALARGRDVVLGALDRLDRDIGDLAEITLCPATTNSLRAISRSLKMR
jgi:hypothetical protein